MMIRNAVWNCLAVVACLGVSVYPELILKPKDTESIVGGSAYFNCSTTDPSKEIQWFHYSLGSSERNMVYGFDEIRGSYLGRFSVKKNIATGEFNLAIIAILAQDAGIYECHDEVAYGNKSQAQLVVLDSTPKCEADMPSAKVLGNNTCGIELDVFLLVCTATFQGNIAPVLQWKKVGESTPITQGVSPPEISQNRVVYNLTLNGDRVVDGSSYICQTTKSSSNAEYSCTSDKIKILSPQNNFSIVHHSSGESIRCPTVVENSCSYKWIHSDQSPEVVVSDAQLVKLSGRGLYRCEADCRIKGKPCTISAMSVYVAEDTTTVEPYTSVQSTSFKVAFIVTLVLLIIIIILLLVCYIRWRKLWRANRPPTVELQPLKQGIITTEVPSNVVYKASPQQIHAIKTQSSEANDRSIKGTAILNNELFIISQLESEVEVYDCTTLRFRRRWQLNDLVDPDDAASCVRNRCIYISDNKAEGKEIFRVDVEGNIVARWSIGDESGRLSITDQSSVLLSLHDSSRLKEFSPDGLLIREIILPTGLTHPMHALRLANGNFVMTQGYLEDSVHRVCEVNPDGKFVRAFGGNKGVGSECLTNPTYLAIDREGSIMIADAGNGRVVLVGSNFEYRRELISRNSGLHIPTRICLDEVNGRLYVAEYKRDMRSLLVFNIR